MFLEILTRCYKRPAMLAANQESLRRQTSGDWIQTVLVDDLGRGVAWANQRLGAYAPHLVGDYIWVVDDDDLCTLPTLVAELAAIVANYAPDVIMLRMDHGPLGVLPDDAHWQDAPERGYIGVSAYVVRRELWRRHADAWRPIYESDFDFIKAVLDDTPHVIWYDVIASRVQRISRGEPEHA